MCISENFESICLSEHFTIMWKVACGKLDCLQTFRELQGQDMKKISNYSFQDFYLVYDRNVITGKWPNICTLNQSMLSSLH